MPTIRRLTSPDVRTADNFLSVCRVGHGVFFLAYALLLVIVIIMVWLTQNGSITATVNAWVDTFISVVVLILMGLHWHLYVRGVIPSCCNSDDGCKPQEEVAQPMSTTSGLKVSIQSGAETSAK